MTRTITITSGKGGVGKTNISVNLALHLATLGYRICLFDADLGLANINILLGLYPEYNLEDVILYHRDLEDIIIRNYEGIDIIPGSSGVERMANLEADQIEHLTQSFSKLDGYNFLLFDTSSGVSKNVISFCLASSEVIVVITPEVTSLTDAYALLKILCLNGFKGSVRIVINQCKNTSIARHAYTKFKETVKKYLPIDIVPLGMIIQDPKVEEAIKQQQAFVLLYPESDASKCIKSIAKRLMENQTEDLESGMSLFWTQCFKHVTGPLQLSAKKKEKEQIVGESSRQAHQQGPPQLIQRTGGKRLPEAPETAPEAGRLGDLKHAPLPSINKPTDNNASVSQGLQFKDRRHILFKQIEPSKNLPTLPHIVLKLIDVCNRGESTIENISQIINKDTSLSAKVMGMVNSAYNGPCNRMTNIDEVVFFLGRDAIKTIAISATAYSTFDQAKGNSAFRLKLFWWHSLMCATLSKLIARKTSYPA
ncbi:MAG: HDOD domain-containing protein, partial [Deltaproteobacteria bacterium]|nr:HDOD domain-containing protein [Deltaproteobacteria bacterium]MBW2020755.1 HDOD domain-containing protein [Deltaproteobacteria bacterium]MBW2075591.1 HDOD domain-containing protein [Deltaproteobacteria bacterium]